MVANHQQRKYLTTTTPSRDIHVTHHPQEEDHELLELELDESDVVWGRPDDVVTPPPPLPTIKTTTNNNYNTPTSPLHSLTSPGLTTALPSTSPQSPNSAAFHRRRTHTTTSSPLSMESQGQGGQRGSHHYYRRASVNNMFLPQSAPMQVPAWPRKKNNNIKYGPLFDEEVGLMDGEDDDDDKMVPPHEIVVARSQRETAFSVFEGVGRTLKGRDLTTVRNAVFHKTGFL